MSSCGSLLFKNGIITHRDVPVTTLLENYPGAYTTTRTHNNASQLLFWEKHLTRLSNSIRILLDSHPQFLSKRPEKFVDSFAKFYSTNFTWDLMVQSLVKDSLRKALPVMLEREIKDGEEFAITTLVSGNTGSLSYAEALNEEILDGVFDVYVHVSGYVPPIFCDRGNGARLAVVGHGRDAANAKYSDWVRHRKTLESLRPPTVSELLLSDNGDQILEGCLTNFFVVCRKDCSEDRNAAAPSMGSFELQTAPTSDGILPGVIRQVIIDICLRRGIPFREVAPSWSEREMWAEAFITNSLRLLQHVKTIQVPSPWKTLNSRTWKELTWEEKLFEDDPGKITSYIQKEIMKRVGLEACPISLIDR